MKIFKQQLMGLRQSQLRVFLGLFFITLLIPTAMLIYHAYTQLKWAAYHQHRIMAEELTDRINNNLAVLLFNEESRPFTDYSFLNITGDPVAIFLQRSPLSSFPLNTDMPGIIGYFQIDDRGKISTPLLPPILPKSNKYGLTKKNIAKRLAVNNKIRKILNENQLITLLTQPENYNSLLFLSPTTNTAILNSPIPNILEPEIFDRLSVKNKSQVENLDKNRTFNEFMFTTTNEAQKKQTDEISNSDNELVTTSAVEKFKHSQTKASNNNISLNANAKIDIINTDKGFQMKQPKPEDEFINNYVNDYKNKRKRTEQSILPEQIFHNDTTNTISNRLKNDMKISVFKSEVDSFEFISTRNGQYIFYRNVWRDGKRYVQGFIINAQKFLHSNINIVFRNTALSKISNLALIFQSNLVSIYSNKNSLKNESDNSKLQGALLYQSRLITPLNDFELIYNIKQIPTGPAGVIIAWLSIILFFILSIGLYLIYRLMLSQIKLRNQQQDFVSAVSHELKTPLTSIRMYGEMLKQGWASEDKKSSYYNYIYDESERLSRLINNVLQLAHMTRNDFHVELKPIHVKQLIDSVQTKISSQIERAGFDIVFEMDEKIYNKEISIDSDIFTQIVINIIDNAIKFSAKSELKKIIISCKEINNNSIQISIRDFGPGIAKDQMKKIFNLFYRSENELTRETVGTGIGLALVNQLTSAMRGKIEIINQSPGAEFRLQFSTIIASY